MPRGRQIRRLAFYLVLFLVAAAVAAPFLRADRLRGTIRESLERALHRKVEVGEVRLNLLRGPGFSVSNVVIHDDPSLSIEPFAYVTSLEGRVRLLALVRGRIEFVNLRLSEPSVNLARVPNGRWNFQPLLTRMAETVGPRAAVLPAVQVRGGRINFKSGEVKSVFYFTDADLDIAPGSDGVVIRFLGSPARTDRAAQGFGRLSGRGVWLSNPGGEGRVELGLEMERSGLAEIITLVHGHDIGLHGVASARARLSGPLSEIRVTGRLQLTDLHRWDLLPERGDSWPVDYRGRLDLRSGTLELETHTSGREPAPVGARIRATGLTDRPAWAAIVTARRLAAAVLADLARRLGVPLPPTVAVEGSVDGAASYRAGEGFQGTLAFTGASVDSPDLGRIRLERAEVIISGSRLELKPAAAEFGDQQAATVEGAYSSERQAVEVRLSSRALGAGKPPLSFVPALSGFRSGKFRGWIGYGQESNTPGTWSGSFEIHDGELAVPELAVPLRISGALLLDGGRVSVSRLTARAGKIRCDGEYRYEPSQSRPHRVRLTAETINGAELERHLRPLLNRSQSFLARTLRRSASAPDWLKDRRVEAVVQVGALELGETSLHGVHARLEWDGPAIRMPEFSAEWNGGTFRGTGNIALQDRQPRYALRGVLRNLAWWGGQADLEGKLETAGSGASLVANLRTEGKIAARSVELLDETRLEDLTSEYLLWVAGGIPRLSLKSLQLRWNDELCTGQGGASPDGKLLVELGCAQHPLRLTGQLTPFQLEAASAARTP